MIGRHLRRRTPLAIVVAAVAGIATQAVALAGPVNEVDTAAMPFAVNQAIPQFGNATLVADTAMLTAPTTNGYFFVKQLSRTNGVGSATLQVANGADYRFAQAVTSFAPGTNYAYILVVTNPATQFQARLMGGGSIPATAPASGQFVDSVTVPTLTALDAITVHVVALFEATSLENVAAIDETGTASLVSIS